jgi:hypothetical protein
MTLYVSVSLSVGVIHMYSIHINILYVYTDIRTYTHAHTHTLSLSFSLSLSHTYTTFSTGALPKCEAWALHFSLPPPLLIFIHIPCIHMFMYYNTCSTGALPIGKASGVMRCMSTWHFFFQKQNQLPIVAIQYVFNEDNCRCMVYSASSMTLCFDDYVIHHTSL